ncbi:MAG: hypothetical protein PW788_00815 [Micavibrio sp.]|nr:hypothetical protein [Micavibrio sp.]
MRKSAATAGAPRKPSTQLQVQVKMQQLGRELLNKRELVASGKLQLIGLGKVQKKAGKAWPGLRQVVYEVVEAVLSERLLPEDISFRFQEETYIVIFAKDSAATASRKSADIAEEIRLRLYAAEPVQFKDITVGHSMADIRSEELINAFTPPAATVSTADLSVAPPPAMPAPNAPPTAPPRPAKTAAQKPAAPVTHVNTQPAGHDAMEDDSPLGLFFAYRPIWEVPRDAMTSFLCLPREIENEVPSLETYRKRSESLPYSATLDFDLRVLERVRRDLVRLGRDNKQTMIVCPLHYNTLYRSDGFQQFIHRCGLLPLELRKYLILFVLDPPLQLPVKDAFWFIPKLRRNMCRAVYINVPAPYDLSHPAWAQSEIDGLSFIVRYDMTEPEIMPLLDSFCLTADRMKVRTAVLNIKTLSLASIAISFNAHYLCGDVISGTVPSPDNMFRFKYETLYSISE